MPCRSDIDKDARPSPVDDIGSAGHALTYGSYRPVGMMNDEFGSGETRGRKPRLKALVKVNAEIADDRATA